MFTNVSIKDDVRFSETKVERGVLFEDSFIGGDSDFFTLQTPFLSFISTKFRKPESQEEACRRAKIILEDQGNRDLSDEHFYLEMDAKRKQKNAFKRYVELVLIQWTFGYGVKPGRVGLSWGIIIGIFSVVYYLLNALPNASLIDYIHFSIITAITPGYGGYRLVGKCAVISASIEAIMGTLWWGFIMATIARKYFR